MTEHLVASTADVPSGTAIAVDVGEKRIALFCVSGEYFAIDETCPHRGAPLHDGVVRDRVVHCPWHQWQFDLRDGCSPVNPNSRVSSYRVRVDEGAIWVSL